MNKVLVEGVELSLGNTKPNTKEWTVAIRSKSGKVYTLPDPDPEKTEQLAEIYLHYKPEIDMDGGIESRGWVTTENTYWYDNDLINADEITESPQYIKKVATITDKTLNTNYIGSGDYVFTADSMDEFYLIKQHYLAHAEYLVKCALKDYHQDIQQDNTYKVTIHFTIEKIEP